MDSLRYFLSPVVTSIGVAGFVLGGHFVWLGISTFPVLMILDLVLPPDTDARNIPHAWIADMHLFLQLPLMIGLYAAFLISVKSGRNDLGSGMQLVGSFLSIGWLSAVPTLPIAHELMHRRHWFPRRVAQLLSTFYGEPNRDIAHVTIHHLHLDTRKDGDTAYRGQSVYSFVFTATFHAFADGLHAEALSLRRQGLSAWNWRNKTYQEVLLLICLPAGCLLVGNVTAALVAIIAMAMAKGLVEGFNYYQHYGLIRVEGKPIELHHAWNHLGMIVRPIGSEITNHIHHHLNGYTRFYDLKPEPDAPRMPSLFLCFALGFVPPLWFRFIAKPRLEDWDRRFASPEEKKLAMAANERAGWAQWLEPDLSSGRLSTR